MIINRVWAMPNRETFKIAPIKALLDKYVGDGLWWIDPFAGDNSPAQFTNDLNPNTKAQLHLPADIFIKSFALYVKGVIFDPPYSQRQIKECYGSIGLSLSMEDTQLSFWSKVKDAAAPKVKTGGYAICCGWNTNGFGKERGFELIEILLVAHGSNHNDTIVTVEQKINHTLDLGD